MPPTAAVWASSTSLVRVPREALAHNPSRTQRSHPSLRLPGAAPLRVRPNPNVRRQVVVALTTLLRRRVSKFYCDGQESLAALERYSAEDPAEVTLSPRR
jgi:hypothetical protein